MLVVASDAEQEQRSSAKVICNVDDVAQDIEPQMTSLDVNELQELQITFLTGEVHHRFAFVVSSREDMRLDFERIQTQVLQPLIFIVNRFHMLIKLLVFKAYFCIKKGVLGVSL
jgi:hypothetical protein